MYISVIHVLPFPGQDKRQALVITQVHMSANPSSQFGPKSNEHRLGGADDVSNSTNTPSYEGSPVQMSNYHHYHNGTQHHPMHHERDSNPYPKHASSFVPIGESPSESPLKAFSPQQIGRPLAGPPRVPPSTQGAGPSINWIRPHSSEEGRGGARAGHVAGEAAERVVSVLAS